MLLVPSLPSRFVARDRPARHALDVYPRRPRALRAPAHLTNRSHINAALQPQRLSILPAAVGWKRLGCQSDLRRESLRPVMHDFANVWIGELGNRAARFGKRNELIRRCDQLPDHDLSVVRCAFHAS